MLSGQSPAAGALDPTCKPQIDTMRIAVAVAARSSRSIQTHLHDFNNFRSFLDPARALAIVDAVSSSERHHHEVSRCWGGMRIPRAWSTQPRPRADARVNRVERTMTLVGLDP